MSNIKTYVSYRLWKFKQDVLEAIRGLSKLKTWVTIYGAIFIAYLFFVIYSRRFETLMGAIIVFGVWLAILIYKDYISGDHNRWKKQKGDA